MSPPRRIGVPLLTNAYNAPSEHRRRCTRGTSPRSRTRTTTSSLLPRATCHERRLPGEGVRPFGSVRSTVPPTRRSTATRSSTARLTAHSRQPGNVHRGPRQRPGWPALGLLALRGEQPRQRRLASRPGYHRGTCIADLGTTIDQPGNARWFKVHVVPGGSVTVDLSGLSADYDVYMFKDIAQTYAATHGRAEPDEAQRRSSRAPASRAPASADRVLRFRVLGLRASADPGSPGPGSRAPGSAPTRIAAPGSRARASRAPGSRARASRGSGFSGSGFSGSGFSGSGFSGSGFSADSFSAAQVYSLIGWSNNLGTRASTSPRTPGRAPATSTSASTARTASQTSSIRSRSRDRQRQPVRGPGRCGARPGSDHQHLQLDHPDRHQPLRHRRHERRWSRSSPRWRRQRAART